MIENISVVIIVKNGAKTITKALDSLKEFQEVIIYDNGSTDNTIKIAQSYSNVKLIKGDFLGFGETKNLATTYANNDWILSLDSDEIITPKLLQELQNITLDQNYAYEIKRDNYFFDKEIKYSGWGKDYLIRLYNRKNCKFNQNIVHEFIICNKDIKIQRLINSFKHNAVQDLNQFLFKVAKYSDLASKDKKTCFFLVVILKSFFTFFKTYFIQLGFLDGWRGFVISISNFNGKFFRYTKRYINCKNI